MAIEIVDCPIENAGSFHSFLYVYQRVGDGIFSHIHVVSHPDHSPMNRANPVDVSVFSTWVCRKIGYPAW